MCREVTRDNGALKIMSPTRGMHHLRSAHLFIGSIAIALQDTFELTQKALRTFPIPSHAEVILSELRARSVEHKV
jgi:hypothetical protein